MVRRGKVLRGKRSLVRIKESYPNYTNNDSGDTVNYKSMFPVTKRNDIFKAFKNESVNYRYFI